MKTLFISVVILLAYHTAVLACPACAVSGPQNDSWKTFWMLSIMGILPVAVALIVGLYIARIGKSDEIKISSS